MVHSANTQSAYNHIASLGVDRAEIIIYGHSLGGSIAMHLAARVKTYKMLIVENTFTKLRYQVCPNETLADYLLYPLQLDGWETIAEVGKIAQDEHKKSLPMVFMHSKSDPRVNVKFSSYLYNAAVAHGLKPLRIQCDSNDHHCTKSPSYTGDIGRIMDWTREVNRSASVFATPT